MEVTSPVKELVPRKLKQPQGEECRERTCELPRSR